MWDKERIQEKEFFWLAGWPACKLTNTDRLALQYFISFPYNRSHITYPLVFISVSDMVMVGAASSREFIAHECAPSKISNMSG
jgi:hypothetical protein